MQGELDVIQVPTFIDIQTVSVLDQRDNAGKIVYAPSNRRAVSAHLFRYLRPFEAGGMCEEQLFDKGELVLFFHFRLYKMGYQ